MKDKKVGFIGSGKMAGAIIKAIIKSGFLPNENIIATKSSPEGLPEKEQELGVRIILDNKKLSQESDIIFLAVKPNQMQGVLQEIKDAVFGKLVVSLAAGVSINSIKNVLGEGAAIIRVMPNTPIMAGAGMCGIVPDIGVKNDDLEYILSLFNTAGKTIVVEESQIDTVTAISGSGPAFFYKVINDIALAGSKLGLSYEKALELSIQTALGAAKMAEARQISMEELISNVATKGGCTRVGVDVMEEKNLQGAFEEVIEKTAKKANELGK